MSKTNPLNQQERNSSSSQGGPPEGGFAAMVPELDVTDIGVSLAFWCGPLGFTIAYSRPDAGFFYLQRGVLQIMLCQKNGEWDTGNLERPFGRGVNFQMQVDHVEPIAEQLKQAGWRLFRPIAEKSYRVGDEWFTCKEFLVQDPDGYLLRFSARR